MRFIQQIRSYTIDVNQAHPRPSELVLDILIDRQRGAFTKEDGEKVIDEFGNRKDAPNA